jgi:hypothetical protein
VSRLITGPQVPVPFGPLTGTIFTASYEAMFDLLAPLADAATGGGAWPAANRALLVPFEIASPRVVTEIVWYNGSGISGNVDAGIYTTAGGRIVSTGSTAQSGSTAQQVVDITDTLLLPGVYYMALAMDNGTGTIVRWQNYGTQQLIASGMQQAATAFPLPDPVTLANPATNYVPCMALGFQTVM